MVAVREKSKKQARVVEALQLARSKWACLPGWKSNADKAEGGVQEGAPTVMNSVRTSTNR